MIHWEWIDNECVCELWQQNWIQFWCKLRMWVFAWIVTYYESIMIVKAVHLQWIDGNSSHELYLWILQDTYICMKFIYTLFIATWKFNEKSKLKCLKIILWYLYLGPDLPTGVLYAQVSSLTFHHHSIDTTIDLTVHVYTIGRS